MIDISSEGVKIGTVMTVPIHGQLARSSIGAAMLVDLLGSWSSPRGPLYRLLAERIADLVDTGQLPAGVRLPAERELATAASISRNTAATAYQVLRDEGLAETRRGSGTVVTPRRTTPGAVHRANAFFARLLASSTIEVDLTLAAPDCAPQVAEALDDPRSVLDPEIRRCALAGGGYHLHGLPMLRAVLADRLAADHGIPTTAEQVLVTTGAQQATDLLLRVSVLPGQAAVIEDPTFPGLIDAAYRAGARPVGLPAASGIDPDRLARLLETHRPAVVHLVLTHHNPTGRVVGLRERHRLVELAAGNPQTVFVDDLTLAELALPTVGSASTSPLADPEPADPTPVPLAALAPDLPNLVTIGSLSKTYWGGLRIGWVRGSSVVIGRIAAAKAAADLGAPVFPQAIAAALAADRHSEIVRWRTAQLGRNRDALERALRAALPGWSWQRPRGGLSLLARLGPTSLDAGVYAQTALRHGVAVVPGRLLSLNDRHTNTVRISFARPAEQLERAVSRLAEAWATTVPGR